MSTVVVHPTPHVHTRHAHVRTRHTLGIRICKTEQKQRVHSCCTSNTSVHRMWCDTHKYTNVSNRTKTLVLTVAANCMHVLTRRTRIQECVKRNKGSVLTVVARPTQAHGCWTHDIITSILGCDTAVVGVRALSRSRFLSLSLSLAIALALAVAVLGCDTAIVGMRTCFLSRVRALYLSHTRAHSHSLSLALSRSLSLSLVLSRSLSLSLALVFTLFCSCSHSRSLSFSLSRCLSLLFLAAVLCC